MIKYIKKVFKKFDYFSVYIHFHYKHKDRYKSTIGGLTFIILMILVIVYVSLNIQNFIRRKNLSIISYDNYINETDIISFDNFSMSFAFGLECQNYEKFGNLNDIYDLFVFSLKYVQLERNNSILRSKKKFNVNFHKCSYLDFKNKFNETVDFLGLKYYNCPDNLTEPIRGLYSHEKYYYYEITVSANENNEFDLYYNLLTDSDCKLSLFYTDSSLDLKNHYKPYSQHISQRYLQLSPVDFKKKDIYFLLYKFDSYENLLFQWMKSYYYVAFEKQQDNINYKGSNRFTEKPEDYDKFAKFFLRGDTKRIQIERHYMKLTEFVAQMMSLFSSAFFILNIITWFINKFFLYNSIMKNIFLFKKGKEIVLNNVNGTKASYDRRFIKNYFNFTKITCGIHNKKNFLDNINETIKVMNNNEIIKNINKIDIKKQRINFQKSIKNDEVSSNCAKNNFSINNNNNINLNNSEDNEQSLSSSSLKIKKQKVNLNNFYNKKRKKSVKFELIDNEDNNSKIELKDDLNIKKETKKYSYKKLNKNIAYINKKRNSFSNSIINIHLNLLESLILIICPCLACKNLSKKKKLLENGKEKIFESLDVLNYLKLTQELKFLEIIFLNKNEYNILKYISKPCISLVNKYSEENTIKKTDKEKLNEFFENYKILLQNKNKTLHQQKLEKIIEIEINNLF